MRIIYVDNRDYLSFSNCDYRGDILFRRRVLLERVVFELLIRLLFKASEEILFPKHLLNAEIVFLRCWTMFLSFVKQKQTLCWSVESSRKGLWGF